MPQTDMPLSELLQYEGMTPCPADFDEYWDRTLAELDRHDPQVTMTPAGFQTPGVECFDLYFTGLGGARVYAKYLRPKNAKKPMPAILNFHGYSGASGNWSTYLGEASVGFAVAAMDCRGQGGKSEDNLTVTGNTQRGHIIRGLDAGPEKLYYRYVFSDTALLARIIMSFEEVDETRVCAKGGSQGGGLTLACAALEPRIAKAAPHCPFLSDYKRSWHMDLTKRAYAELTEYFRRFDPMHEREDEVWTTLGYIDIQNLAKRIKAQVLMATGLLDDCVPPSTQFACYNKITSEKRLRVYPDFNHEGYPGTDDAVLQWFMELL